MKGVIFPGEKARLHRRSSFLQTQEKKIRNTQSDARSRWYWCTFLLSSCLLLIFGPDPLWWRLYWPLSCHEHLRKRDPSNKSHRFLFVSSELLFLIIILPLVLPQNQPQTTVLCCVVKIKWKRIIKRDFYLPENIVNYRFNIYLSTFVPARGRKALSVWMWSTYSTQSCRNDTAGGLTKLLARLYKLLTEESESFR